MRFTPYVFLVLLFTSSPAGSQSLPQGVPPVPALPTAPGMPTMPTMPGLPQPDPARLQMEEQLRQLQRRERFETLDTKTRLEVLTNIVALCIDLGRDCPSEEAKLQEAEKQLGKEEEQVVRRQRIERRITQLLQRARNALLTSPPEWFQARQAAVEVLRLAPRNAEAIAFKTRAEKGLRDALIYRSIVGVLAGGAGLAAIVAVWRRFRKGGLGGVRTLEMVEGPNPGETFALEKEQVVLGALPAEADWVIPDPARRISRRHCEIQRSGKYYFLTDCSSNGTRINDKTIARGEPVLLRRGDRIALTDDVIVVLK